MSIRLKEDDMGELDRDYKAEGISSTLNQISNMHTPIFKSLMFFCFVALCLSCGKDDPGPELSTNIIAKWQATAEQIYDCPNTADNGTRECGALSFCFVFEFKSDLSYEKRSTSNNSYIDSGTYEIEGNVVKLTRVGANFPTLAVAEINGESLTLTYNAFEAGCRTKYSYDKVVN